MQTEQVLQGLCHKPLSQPSQCCHPTGTSPVIIKEGITKSLQQALHLMLLLPE